MTADQGTVSSPRKTPFGPGLLVTAAFIGPGTVITASRAGTEFGCELLWTILLASVGTILLQSLAARLGIETGSGLSEAIRSTLFGTRWFMPTLVLILLAIGFGNAAYQTGNLTGAVVGVTGLFGGSAKLWVAFLAAIVIALIGLGKDRLLQRTLITLVCVLSVAFLITAAIALPPPSRILKGLFVPKVSTANLSLVVALIGTTIVPYNLFLHASRSATTWKDTPRDSALRLSRLDTVFSISLGGLLTAAILLTASSAFHDQGTKWDSPDQIAMQLRPTLGTLSGVTFALGLFAAGLTSAITAPLATAYAVCGCLGWSTQTDSPRFRGIAILVVLTGTVAAVFLDGSPVSTIVAAQVANGLLLPVIAVIMLLVVQRQARVNQTKMSTPSLIAAWIVVSLIGALGLWRMTTGVMKLF
ncbi:Nramp family divalent metal transporter [Rhodopirellula sp. SWK7]|uniref:Nramp family divalent metal transporter n=1 Tax=Rhodopirellula sp. SWK7 TaxID=595460 RepID=UPI0002BFCCF9|nr:Nramp family divalent metal transporter [Rhodopirellula sp. SWK7]EMI43567.1 Mn2+/Fe2+ transporter, NRAMP family protein [Rhodopirellula sp. SWK7]